VRRVTTTELTGNAVGQQDVVSAVANEGESANETGFMIPRRLTERHRSLLMATPEERARGVVGALKCGICPRAGFKKWKGFKKWESFIRHCERSEVNPETYILCRYCGAFFARPDACKRHEEKRPHTCTSVGLAQAEEKRRVTQQVFAQRIVHLYPDSVKRGSRQQNRLKS
jgi:hypothetical protein